MCVCMFPWQYNATPPITFVSLEIIGAKYFTICDNSVYSLHRSNFSMFLCWCTAEEISEMYNTTLHWPNSHHMYRQHNIYIKAEYVSK